MKKISTASTQLSPRSVGALLKRFHLIISFVLISALLAAVVLLVNNVILNPPSSDTTPTQQGESLSPLQSFHTSDELKAPTSAPAVGRQSPFTE